MLSFARNGVREASADSEREVGIARAIVAFASTGCCPQIPYVRIAFAGRVGNCDNRLQTLMKNFSRITVDPAQMGGVPCVRGVRIPVATVLRMLAGGLTERE